MSWTTTNSTQHSISRNNLTLLTEPYFFPCLSFAFDVPSGLSMHIFTQIPANRAVCNKMFVQTQVFFCWASLVKIRSGPSRNKVKWMARAFNPNTWAMFARDIRLSFACFILKGAGTSCLNPLATPTSQGFHVSGVPVSIMHSIRPEPSHVFLNIFRTVHLF
jgi:hypothetical protein